MTIQEMHDSVMQGVDKINAQVADTLLSNEIDRELNKAIQRFVNTRFQQNNRYGQGFEESQKRRDDLRSLVTETVYNTDFKEEVRGSTHPNGALYADSFSLPNDYMYMIHSMAGIQRMNDCSKIPYILEDQDSIYYFVIPVSDFLANGGTNWIDSLWIVPGNQFELNWGNEGFGMTNIWTNEDYQGVSYNNNEQEIIDSVLDTGFGMGPGSVTFYENFIGPTPGFGIITSINNLVFPGSIVIAFTNTLLANSLGVENVNADPSLGDVPTLVGRYNNENVVSTPIQYQQDLGLKRIPSTKDFIRESYACRMVQHDDVFTMSSDPFNKTKYSSPLTVMRGNIIDIYSDDEYITEKLRLTYLRKPATVSQYLNAGCDLPEHTHQEIVTLAVSSILEAISDPRYQTHQMEMGNME